MMQRTSSLVARFSGINIGRRRVSPLHLRPRVFSETDHCG